MIQTAPLHSCPLTPVVSKASSGVMEVMEVYGYESLADMLKVTSSPRDDISIRPIYTSGICLIVYMVLYRPLLNVFEYIIIY